MFKWHIQLPTCKLVPPCYLVVVFRYLPQAHGFYSGMLFLMILSSQPVCHMVKKWYFQAHCLWLWISPSHEGSQSKTWTSSILHLAQTGTRWYYASGFRMLFDLDKNKINNNIVSNVATFSDYQTYHSSFKITIWRMMPVAWILNVLLHFK